MTDAVFVSITQSYYIGNLDTITTFTPTKTFTRKVGYLMSFDLTLSCLSHTYTYSTAVTMTPNVLSFTTLTSNTGNANGLGMNSNTLALEAQGTNQINPVWCTDQRIITTPAMADKTYYVNDPQLAFSVPMFTLDIVCADESWTMNYAYLVAGTPTTMPAYIGRTNLAYTVLSNNYLHANTY